MLETDFATERDEKKQMNICKREEAGELDERSK
jgi:hypothetical protein